MLLERIVAALEIIAAALTAIANGQGTAPAAGNDIPNAAPERRQTKAEKDAAAKAAKEAADKAAAAATKVEQATPAAGAKVEQAKADAAEPDFDYERIRAVVVEMVGAGAEGKSAVVNVLSKYGARKASEVDKAKWPELFEALTKEFALLKGEDDLS